MATRKEKLEYLKVSKISQTIGASMSIPIMVWLYYIGYMVVFKAFVIICVIEFIVGSYHIAKLMRALGLNES